MIPRHISIRRLTPEKNKTRLAARSVLAVLLASYSLKLESRSSEGLPQLLKLTHPSNTRCYKLMQESNYQKYPSNNKKKKSSQPTTARDTSSESHSEANLVDLMPCSPSSLPCSALQPPCCHQAESVTVHANGTVYTTFIW